MKANALFRRGKPASLLGGNLEGAAGAALKVCSLLDARLNLPSENYSMPWVLQELPTATADAVTKPTCLASQAKPTPTATAMPASTMAIKPLIMATGSRVIVIGSSVMVSIFVIVR
jgi:hypothetical protein